MEVDKGRLIVGIVLAAFFVIGIIWSFVHDALVRRGVRVEFEQHDKEHGSAWRDGISKKLRNRVVALVVRRKDGRENDYETELMSSLQHVGVNLKTVPRTVATEYWKNGTGEVDCPLIIATVWTTDESLRLSCHCEGFTEYHIDLRIISSVGGKTLGALSFSAARAIEVTHAVLDYLSGIDLKSCEPVVA